MPQRRYVLRRVKTTNIKRRIYYHDKLVKFIAQDPTILDQPLGTIIYQKSFPKLSSNKETADLIIISRKSGYHIWIIEVKTGKGFVTAPQKAEMQLHTDISQLEKCWQHWFQQLRLDRLNQDVLIHPLIVFEGTEIQVKDMVTALPVKIIGRY